MTRHWERQRKSINLPPHATKPSNLLSPNREGTLNTLISLTETSLKRLLLTTWKTFLRAFGHSPGAPERTRSHVHLISLILLSLASAALNFNSRRPGPFWQLCSFSGLYKCHSFILLVKDIFYKLTLKAFLSVRFFLAPVVSLNSWRSDEADCRKGEKKMLCYILLKSLHSKKTINSWFVTWLWGQLRTLRPQLNEPSHESSSSSSRTVFALVNSFYNSSPRLCIVLFPPIPLL